MAEAHARAALTREVNQGRVDQSVLDTAIKPNPPPQDHPLSVRLKITEWVDFRSWMACGWHAALVDLA